LQYIQSARVVKDLFIQGKGVPDVNTRIMIKKIWNALQIPVLGLMDADPHGEFRNILHQW